MAEQCEYQQQVVEGEAKASQICGSTSAGQEKWIDACGTHCEDRNCYDFELSSAQAYVFAGLAHARQLGMVND